MGYNFCCIFSLPTKRRLGSWEDMSHTDMDVSVRIIIDSNNNF